jgi:hypothetical protein
MSSSDLPEKDRRRHPRRHPKQHLQVACRKGTTGLGPNVARALLDVSLSGLRLSLTERLEPGQDVEVELQTPEMSRPLRVVADVIWCAAEDEGSFVAGAELRHSLTYAEFRDLT